MEQFKLFEASSEFSSDGYAKSTLAKALEDAFKNKEPDIDLLKSQLFEVTEDFKEMLPKKNYPDLYTCLKAFANAPNDLFSFQTNEKPIETSKYIRSFTESVDHFSFALKLMLQK